MRAEIPPYVDSGGIAWKSGSNGTKDITRVRTSKVARIDLASLLDTSITLFVTVSAYKHCDWYTCTTTCCMIEIEKDCRAHCVLELMSLILSPKDRTQCCLFIMGGWARLRRWGFKRRNRVGDGQTSGGTISYSIRHRNSAEGWMGKTQSILPTEV